MLKLSDSELVSEYLVQNFERFMGKTAWSKYRIIYEPVDGKSNAVNRFGICIRLGEIGFCKTAVVSDLLR